MDQHYLPGHESDGSAQDMLLNLFNCVQKIAEGLFGSVVAGIMDHLTAKPMKGAHAPFMS